MIRTVLSRTNLVQLGVLSFATLVAGTVAALTPPAMPGADTLTSAAETEAWLEKGTRDLRGAVEQLQLSGFMRSAPRQSAPERGTEDTATSQPPEIMAIVLSNGESLVYAKLNGELIAASRGEMIGDWRVEDIRSDAILLTNGDRSELAAPFSSLSSPSPPLP